MKGDIGVGDGGRRAGDGGQAGNCPPPPKFGQKLFFGQKSCKIRAFC